jgi:Protein of unknown function (DUF2975)
VSQKPVPPLNARMCRRLAILTAASAAGFLTVNAILWAVPDWAPIVARDIARLQLEPITLTPMVRLEGFVCSTLYLAVLVWGLCIARSLFKRLAVGLVFEPQTGMLLRRFGVVLVVYAALTPFVGGLMSLLVTMHNIPGQRLFRFGISDEEIVLAIVGTLILATGSVMAEAARMAEENRQII